jgi:GNAT superfamily N-acetyltransferase
MTFLLRDFVAADADAVNAIALTAFEQYRTDYSDWAALSQNIGNMAALAEGAEIIVATVEDKIVGAVAYVGPHLPKRDLFQQEWPILRMLVVSPVARGLGVGKALTEECVRRARRDGASLIALHTSPIMQVALPMYLRMGFSHEKDVPPILGVSYAVYTKSL